MMKLLDTVLVEIRALREEFDGRFDKLDTKIQDLSSFRWKVIGFSSAIAFIVTIAVEFLRN